MGGDESGDEIDEIDERGRDSRCGLEWGQDRQVGMRVRTR